MHNIQKRSLAALLSVLILLGSSFTSMAHADFAATSTAFDSAQTEYQKADLLGALESEQLRDQLVEMGVSPEEVEDRIAALTPAEVQQLNEQIDQMAAGGDVVGVLLTLFIVFVVTDAICATDIFPFINCVNN